MSSSSPKVASLTSTLLVAKGNANASGFTALHAAPVAPRGSVRPAPRPPKEEAQHLSLRLDPAQLRRLRLAAAHLDQTEQAFLITALEHYINHVVSPLLDGQCGCLEAEHKPRQAVTTNPFARQKSDLPQ
jgi:hypothetical protein